MTAHRVRRPSSKTRKVLAAVGGGLLTLVGIALLPLPGPGTVVVAAGLAVLATQFRWAARPLRYAAGKAEQGMDQVARSALSAAFAVACALVVAGTGVAVLAGVRIPFVGTPSAVFLVLSGAFLLGVVLYARTRPRRRREGPRRPVGAR